MNKLLQFCCGVVCLALCLVMGMVGCRRNKEPSAEASQQKQKSLVVESLEERVDRALADLEAARIDGVIDGRQFAELSRTGRLNAVYRLTPKQFFELLASEGITYEDQKNLLNMITLSYCYGKAKVDPVGLARDFMDTANETLALDVANGLGRHAPELAIETIREMPNIDSRYKVLLSEIALRSAARDDMERAIRVFESMAGSRTEKENLAIALMRGVDAETIGNQGGVQRVTEIIGAFSQSSLSTYPAAISTLASCVAFKPLDEVLEVFPIDGEPWQRMGAITYLKAFAPGGTPGSDKIGQFLDSEQAIHLTPVERSELERLRGGFFPTP